MKKIFLGLIYFLFLSQLYAQYEQNLSYQELSKGVEIYKNIYSVEHQQKGIAFVNKEGKQYKKYYNHLQCGLVFAGSESKYSKDALRISPYSNQFEVLPFIEVVKELENIDETYLDNYFKDLNGRKKHESDPSAFITFFICKINLFGFARKGDKYAYITKFGKLITDFKYSRDFYGIYRIDTLQNKKLYVDVDALGKEIYTGELPFSHALSENVYQVYNLQDHVYLHYDGFNYPFGINTPLSNAVVGFYGMLRGCNTLGRGNYIYHLNKGMIKSKKIKRYGVWSNFYKNRAIATKRNENSPETVNLFIINEKGKAVKSIPKEFIESYDVFDYFGLIEIYSQERGNVKNLRQEGKAVIDYNGNIIIPYCTNCDINDIGNGLRNVTYYYPDSKDKIKETSGLYNQYGQKISSKDLELLEGIEYNYLMEGIFIHFILDKNNNILSTQKN